VGSLTGWRDFSRVGWLVWESGRLESARGSQWLPGQTSWRQEEIAFSGASLSHPPTGKAGGASTGTGGPGGGPRLSPPCRISRPVGQ